MSHITIDVPDGADIEVRVALRAAAEDARIRSINAPDRKIDPDTRRYAWHDVFVELSAAAMPAPVHAPAAP
jgi:hypothetical protein